MTFSNSTASFSKSFPQSKTVYATRVAAARTHSDVNPFLGAYWATQACLFETCEVRRFVMFSDEMGDNLTTVATESEIQAFQAGSGEVVHGFDEMGSQRISVVSDQANGFHCNREKSDSFVVDIDGLNHSADSNPTSRITRNLSRKGSVRGAGEKRTGSSPTSNDRDGSLLTIGSSSPKATTVGSGMPEVQPLGTALGTADHPPNLPSHHQITITAGNFGTDNAESKWSNRRSYSFRRPPPTWALDPRKILLFFATLSSMGTILLIYFTLSMSKASIEDVPLE